MMNKPNKPRYGYGTSGIQCIMSSKRNPHKEGTAKCVQCYAPVCKDCESKLSTAQKQSDTIICPGCIISEL
jgi:hypothetical protein